MVLSKVLEWVRRFQLNCQRIFQKICFSVDESVGVFIIFLVFCCNFQAYNYRINTQQQQQQQQQSINQSINQ
jgi:hypothetical protein